MSIDVIHGSCEDLSAIADGSVALTATSPPYWNAIDYDRHAENAEQDYRTRAYGEGFAAYDEYLGWLMRIYRGILVKTKPGGFCAMVVGTVLFEKRHYPLPFDIVSRMQKEGWEFHQDFIWHKCTGGVKRAGSFIQHPYPGYFYPNIMTEYILVFRRPGGEPIYKGRSEAEREAAKMPIDRLFTMDIANTVWHIAPVPPKTLEHPCPYPEEIPWRLILLYSYPGDLVLDPFVGTGQTLKMARYLGRKGVGYDILEQYVRYSRQRAYESPSLRSQQLIAEFSKVPLTAMGGVALANSTCEPPLGE
jgi:DNA modification methylase